LAVQRQNVALDHSMAFHALVRDYLTFARRS
jgi:acyl-CoA thioesterase